MSVSAGSSTARHAIAHSTRDKSAPVQGHAGVLTSTALPTHLLLLLLLVLRGGCSLHLLLGPAAAALLMLLGARPGTRRLLLHCRTLLLCLGSASGLLVLCSIAGECACKHVISKVCSEQWDGGVWGVAAWICLQQRGHLAGQKL